MEKNVIQFMQTGNERDELRRAEWGGCFAGSGRGREGYKEGAGGLMNMHAGSEAAESVLGFTGQRERACVMKRLTWKLNKNVSENLSWFSVTPVKYHTP